MKIVTIYNGVLYQNLYPIEQQLVEKYTYKLIDFLSKEFCNCNEIMKLTCVGDTEILKCIISFIGNTSAFTKAQVYSALWSNGFGQFVPGDSL